MGTMRIMAAGLLPPEIEVGDIKIAWEENDHERMTAVIQRKMDQGVRFYEIGPDTTQRVRITAVQNIQGREVFVADEDFAKLWQEGRVGFFARLRSVVGSPVELIRRITDAGEAARTHTWAMRQPAGG